MLILVEILWTKTKSFNTYATNACPQSSSNVSICMTSHFKELFFSVNFHIVLNFHFNVFVVQKFMT